MVFHVAPQVALPTFPAPPVGSLASSEVDFEVQTGKLAHINDPAGQDRRIFEAWASLGGVDIKDEEIAVDAFNKSAENYLQKNPVILYNHITYLPIGRVLSLTFTPEGLYMQGEILKGDDIQVRWRNVKTVPGTESLANLADQTWALILQGIVRGVSVRGRWRTSTGEQVGKFVNVYSPELGKTIRRYVELLLIEISITPIQIHPGTQIIAANTTAKGLTMDIVRALDVALASPLQPTMISSRGKKMLTDKEKQVIAKANELKALMAQNFKEGEDVSEDVVRALQPLGACIVPDEGTPSQDDALKQLVEGEVKKALEAQNANTQTPDPQAALKAKEAELKAKEAELKAERETLEKMRQEVAPPRGRTSLHTPTGAQPRATGIDDGGGLTVSRALEASTAAKMAGKQGLPAEDEIKLILARNNRGQGTFNKRLEFGEFTLTPSGQRFLQQFQQQHSAQ